jgi:ABC-2 type transport system ATP-binding protein
MTSVLALRAENLRKSYAGVVAVESLSLEVEAGNVVGFLGPNGAGKTTVIRMLSTLLAPDSGTFTVAGFPHTRPIEIRRRLGVLPESARYPHGQTGEEWLTFHARLFGQTRAGARTTAMRLLDEVGLAQRGRARILAYSRGMRQRLGIARALVNDPEVVFLDEPTLGLDPAGQLQVLELVTRITREHGVTVVLSTHLLAEVEQVCAQVLILNHGRVVADGTVADVTRRAAAPRRAVVQVPAQHLERALGTLRQLGIDAVSRADGPRAELELTLAGEAVPERAGADALSRLLASGIPVVGFTLEGGRLSDAFLAVTGAADG